MRLVNRPSPPDPERPEAGGERNAVDRTPPTVTAAAAIGRAASWRSHWAWQGVFWIALIAFVKEAQPLLAPLVVAIVLAFLLSPSVRALRRRGIHEAIAAAVVVAVLIASGGILASALASPISEWWERTPTMVAQLVERIDRIRAAFPISAPPPVVRAPAAGGAAAARRAAAEAAASAAASAAEAARQRAAPDPLKERLASEGVALTGTLLQRAVSVSVSIAATMILLYFLLASEHWVVSRVIEAFPRRRTRAMLLLHLRRAERDIGRYVGTLGLIYTVVGIIVMVCMMALGLPNPLLWGVVAAVLNFIPYIGPVVIAALLLLAALVSFEPGVAVLGPPAVFLLIHAIESNFVSPWFMGQRLVLSPLAIFVSVLFWGWVWGITGALVAVPILVGLRSFCQYNRRLRLLRIFLEGDHVAQTPTLRSLLRSSTRRTRPTPPPR
ncbi:MAG TPA: AI-2E family transporter [Burkholderiaceae bacterium]